MDKKKEVLIQYLTILVLGICIALLLWYIMRRSSVNIDVSFAPDQTVTDNPLMGFAPDGANAQMCEKAGLVYLELTFREWEPQEGTFDIAGFEKKYDIAGWKRKHKHAVLRFVCDVPGTEDHLDIPDWLYEKTGSGTHYDTELGKGYSPDYADPVFRECHKAALEKLAEYCNRDHFVSFVELGSLGHWGEWHCADEQGRHLMPVQKICDEYANLYSDSFKNAVFLARRNYETTVEGHMGFYNDMTGSPEDTQQWLSMLERGGTQKTAGEPLALQSVKSFGKSEPVGGELTSDIPMDRLMGDDLGQTLSLISDSHMTFLGPMVPDLADPRYDKACNSILRRMGYRIYVSDLHTRYNFARNTMQVEVTIANAGPAGFYFDWPVTLYIFDKDKNQVYWEALDTDLRNLGNTGEVSATSEVPMGDAIRDEFYIGVAITDYEGVERITLAIDDGKKPEFIDKAQIIYHFTKE